MKTITYNTDFWGKMDCIQVLRAIASIMIALFHIGFGFYYIKGTNFSSSVQLFYCITGFISMYTSQLPSNENNLYNNIIKKLIKILPLYWIMTILTFIASNLSYINFSKEPASYQELIYSMLFIPYFRHSMKTGEVARPLVGPAWTLFLDILFLFIFTISTRINHKFRGWISSAFCIIIWLFAKFISFEPNPFITMINVDNWLCFVGGILVFYITKTYWSKPWTEKKVVKIITFFIALATLIICYAFGSIPVYGYAILFSISLFTTLICFKKSQMPKYQVWLGDISYSFFLIHYYVIIIIGKFINFKILNIKTIFGSILAIAIIIFVSSISYKIIEVQLGNYLRKLLVKQVK